MCWFCFSALEAFCPFLLHLLAEKPTKFKHSWCGLTLPGLIPSSGSAGGFLWMCCRSCFWEFFCGWFCFLFFFFSFPPLLSSFSFFFSLLARAGCLCSINPDVAQLLLRVLVQFPNKRWEFHQTLPSGSKARPEGRIYFHFFITARAFGKAESSWW